MVAFQCSCRAVASCCTRGYSAAHCQCHTCLLVTGSRVHPHVSLSRAAYASCCAAVQHARQGTDSKQRRPRGYSQQAGYRQQRPGLATPLPQSLRPMNAYLG
jgi:hypothetical protein